MIINENGKQIKLVYIDSSKGDVRADVEYFFMRKPAGNLRVYLDGKLFVNHITTSIEADVDPLMP